MTVGELGQRMSRAELIMWTRYFGWQEARERLAAKHQGMGG